MKKFGVQHFTFRPLANEEGLFPVLSDVADMGYTGVEFCFFGGFDSLGMSAKEFSSRLSELGLKFIGNHFTRAMFNGSHEEAFAYIAQAGGKYAAYNIWGDYNTVDDISAAAEYLNGLSKIAKREGLSLLYHNHAAEFAELDGRLIIDRLFDELDDNVYLEADVFFIAEKGVDVYDYLKTNQKRIRTVHLKQMGKDGTSVDIPDGIIDMKKVIELLPYATDYIVEEASPDSDIRLSLKRNAEFLKAL